MCISSLIGNGECNGKNNIEECNYDGGDCCTGQDEACDTCSGQWCSCHAGGGVDVCISTYIFMRQLRLNLFKYWLPETDACIGEWIGDDVCDSVNNIIGCWYDGGDCCLLGVPCYCDWPQDCFCHQTDLLHCIEE